MRKPTPEIYELGAERIGLEPSACVFVDDLPFNLAPAAELGMATVHHTSSEQTDIRARATARRRAAVRLRALAALAAGAACSGGMREHHRPASLIQLRNQGTRICASAGQRFGRIATPRAEAGGRGLPQAGDRGARPRARTAAQAEPAVRGGRTSTRPRSTRLPESCGRSRGRSVRLGRQQDPVIAFKTLQQQLGRSRPRPTMPGRRCRCRPAWSAERNGHQSRLAGVGGGVEPTPASVDVRRSGRRRQHDLDLLGAGQMHAVGARAVEHARSGRLVLRLVHLDPL